MSDSQVLQVKEASDIVTIIGERVTLKSGGRNLKGNCPFHSEKTPSFFVNPEMQYYKCFGCGESGDVLTFLQKYEGMTFPEALEHLADRAGIKLEKTYKGSQDHSRDKHLEMLSLVADYYHFILTKHPLGKKAKEYIEDRKIFSQSIHDFKLGYSPDSWRALEDFLVKKKGYTKKDMVEAGLSVQKEKNSYDRFRGRLMFPLRNQRGQVVGFSGRTLDPDAKQAKYINSPETSLYHKSKLLFGYNQAKQAIRKADRVVIVEGEFDVISSHQAHVREVVAVKGSALTNDHVKLLSRLTKNIILALDSDDAGQEAIRRSIDIVESHGCSLRILQIPGGKDPDEVARQDPKQWRQVSKETISVYQFYINLALQKFDAKSGQGQRQISEFIIPILNKISNPVEQSFYVKKLAEALNSTEETIQAALTQHKRQPNAPLVSQDEPQQVKRSNQENMERALLANILSMTGPAHALLRDIITDWFQHHYLETAVSSLKEMASKMVEADVKTVVSKLEQAQQDLFRGILFDEKKLLEASEEVLQKNYEQVKERLAQQYAKVELLQLTQDLSKNDLEDSERERLLIRYKQMQEKVKSKA